MDLRKIIHNAACRIHDLPNAFRVLDIMDKAGCDIRDAEVRGGDYWEILPKWYVSKKDAEDLREIVLYKHNYKHRSSIWYKTLCRYQHNQTRPFRWK